MTKVDTWIWRIVWACIGLIFVYMLFGCMTTQKATDYLKKKDKLDDVCAENYPVKDTLIIGDTIVRTDTVETFEVFVDTTTIKDTVYITKTLPGKTITKTVTRIDTVRRRDFAYENVLADQVRQCTDLQIELVNKNTRLSDQVDDMKSKRDKWRVRFFILLGLTIAYVGLRVKKLIPF